MSDEDKTQIVSADDAMAALASAQPIGRLMCTDLTVLESAVGAEIVLTEGVTTVGRSSEAKVQIRAKSISRVHAELFPGAGVWGIKDLGSTNGVKINGERVPQGWLRNGDAVIIGKVPYAYSEEVPQPKAESEEQNFSETMVSDRTMFVGESASAASALLKSTASKDDNDPVTEPTERERTTTSRDAASSPASSSKSNSKLKIGGAIAAVLVLGVGGFVLLGGNAELNNGIEENNHKLERLISRFERAGASRDKSASAAQLEKLAELRDGIGVLTAKYPDSAALHQLDFSAAFLEFTRSIAGKLGDDDLDGARREVATTKVQYERVSEKFSADESAQPSARFEVMGDLLELADKTLLLKGFLKKFTSVNTGEGGPSSELLNKVLEGRQRFAELKKKHNLALSVTYPYLGQVIGQISDSDLSQLDRWQRAR